MEGGLNPELQGYESMWLTQSLLLTESYRIKAFSLSKDRGSH